MLELTKTQKNIYCDVIDYFNLKNTSKSSYNKDNSDIKNDSDDKDIKNKTVKDKTKKNSKDKKSEEKEKKKKFISENEYLLIGYAGTGKTTLVTKLILD